MTTAGASALLDEFDARRAGDLLFTCVRPRLHTLRVEGGPRPDERMRWVGRLAAVYITVQRLHSILISCARERDSKKLL